jgi:hypothetical protein
MASAAAAVESRVASAHDVVIATTTRLRRASQERGMHEMGEADYSEQIPESARKLRDALDSAPQTYRVRTLFATPVDSFFLDHPVWPAVGSQVIGFPGIGNHHVREVELRLASENEAWIIARCASGPGIGP